MKNELGQFINLEVYGRRAFKLNRKNAGLFNLGCEISMTVDGNTVLTEVVYGITLEAIGRYSRALINNDLEAIDEANRLLPYRFQQPIVVGGK